MVFLLPRHPGEAGWGEATRPLLPISDHDLQSADNSTEAFPLPALPRLTGEEDERQKPERSSRPSGGEYASTERALAEFLRHPVDEGARCLGGRALGGGDGRDPFGERREVARRHQP